MSSDKTDEPELSVATDPILGETTAPFSQKQAAQSLNLDNYELIKQLGAGGQGVVWLSEQKSPIKRKVAIKLLSSIVANEELTTRFESEIQALALMDHEHIAKVYEVGKSELHGPFFVMEYCPGKSISSHCDGQKLSIRERLKLFVKICKGVFHAHQKGIIHRDLKPSNILVTSKDNTDVPKVIDFGLAKAIDDATRLSAKSLQTEVGSLRGTLGYMSPEQASANGNEALDTRTDVYSLGVILYQLLVGEIPLDRFDLTDKKLFEIAQLICESDAPSLMTTLQNMTHQQKKEVIANRNTSSIQLEKSLNGELIWIVQKALAVDPLRRYRSVVELFDDVERYLECDVVLARPASKWYLARKFAKRNKIALSIASVLFLFMAITTVAVIASNYRVTKALAGETQAVENLQESLNRKDRIVEVFVNSFDSSNPINPEANADFRPQDILIQALSEIQENDFDDDPIAKAELLSAIGRSLNSLGAHKEGIEALKESVALFLEEKGESDWDYLKSLGALGLAYSDSGMDLDAINIDKMNYELRLKKFGEKSQRTLTALNNYASSLGDIGRYRESIDIHKRVMEFRIAEFGKKNGKTLSSMNNYALALSTVGKHEESIEILKETLEIREQELGPNDPKTIVSLRNLAAAYSETGELAKGIEIQSEAVKRSIEKYSDLHPSTLEMKRKLLEFKLAQGLYLDAEKGLRQSYETSMNALGQLNVSTLKSMYSLASVCLKVGKTKESITLLENLIEIQKNKQQEYDSFTLAAQKLLAEACQENGDNAKALKLLSGLLEHAEEKHGDERIVFLKFSLAMASLESENSQFDAAKNRLRSAEKVLLKNHGTLFPLTLKCQFLLANLLRDTGSYDEAIMMQKKVYETRKQQFGSSYQSTLVAMDSLADAYMSKGNFREGIRIFQEATKLSQKRLGPYHDVSSSIKIGLANGYMTIRRPNEALKILLELCETLTARYGSNNRKTLQARNSLGSAFSAAGQHDKAIKTLSDVLDDGKNCYDENHRFMLMTNGNLASAYRAKGEYGTAIERFEKTLNLQRITLKSGHPDMIRTLGHLGYTYRENGQFREAIKTFEERLEMCRNRSAGLDRETLKAMNDLAAAYFSIRDLKKSIPLFEETLDGQLKILGRDDNATQWTVANLGANYREAGQLDKALPLLKEAYQSSQKKHPNLKWARDALRAAYAKSGNAEEHEKLANAKLNEIRSAHGSQSMGYSIYLEFFGLEYAELKNYKKAESYFRQALSIRVTKKDWTAHIAKGYLGFALAKQEKFDEALTELKASLDKLESLNSENPKVKLAKARFYQTLMTMPDEIVSEDEKKEWKSRKEKLNLRKGP